MKNGLGRGRGEGREGREEGREEGRGGERACGMNTTMDLFVHVCEDLCHGCGFD